jgi:hypothetical protein
MKVTVSKILNKTDLAQSGSHGGLVVTKSDQQILMDFFETPGTEQEFTDRADQEIFHIRYQDYTTNGTTPNDRITPIGKYASKHELQPGDILILDKIDTGERKDYFIEYARHVNSVFFAGKSKTTVDILNFDQLINILTRNISEGTINRISANEYEMEVRYLGLNGTLKILQNESDYELYFNNASISENKKYFELDTSVSPFELKKTGTWCVIIDMDEADIASNEAAEEELITELADMDVPENISVYNPIPEPKAPEKESKGRMVPARNKQKSEHALARAEFKCEIGNHETFLRKKNLLPYTEPHHLIPLQYDNQFAYSLDVEANIVSLCSNCHNKIHYGADIEQMLRQLWEQRKEELEAAGLMEMKSGIRLTEDILLSFYGIK